MTENKKHLIETYEELKGQHVLIDRKVLRLIGMAEDDHDFLFILWDGRKIHQHTILDRLSALKGKIDDEHYNDMVQISKLNHYDSEGLYHPVTPEEKQKTKEFAASTKARIEIQLLKTENGFKLLAPLNWEIN